MRENEELKKRLSDMAYKVTREGATEPAFSGEYYDYKEKGVYCCVVCGSPLFSSEHKYDSKTGWPSFIRAINKNALEEREDRKFLRVRTEVICSNCKSHLGHVFPDGPDTLSDGPLRRSISEASRKATGLRYCINSAALKFKPQ